MHLIFCWKKQVPGADLSQSRIIPDRSLLRFPIRIPLPDPIVKEYLLGKLYHG